MLTTVQVNDGKGGQAVSLKVRLRHVFGGVSQGFLPSVEWHSRRLLRLERQPMSKLLVISRPSLAMARIGTLLLAQAGQPLRHHSGR